MENISINTSQNVSIEQSLSSVGERIAATALDMLFYIGYIFLIAFIGGASQNEKIMGILALPLMFYHLLSEIFMNGQSWGKRIMKIRVVKMDGTQPGFLSYFLRWVFRIVDITILFGSVATLTIIFNKKGQRIGDIAANTTVISVREKRVSETLFTRLPEDYVLNYAEVEQLNDKDLYTVKEVLSYLKSSERCYEAMHMADKTRKALENKMNIVCSIRSEHFLFKVLRDYNYIHGRSEHKSA